MIIDRLAFEYGKTFDEIGRSFSLRDVDIAMRKINQRRNNEFALTASLHGVRREIILDDEKPESSIPLSDAEERAIELARASALANIRSGGRPWTT